MEACPLLGGLQVLDATLSEYSYLIQEANLTSNYWVFLPLGVSHFR